MSDDSARRVEELFARLFDASAAERSAALAAAGDAGVAAEVARLLDAHDALAAAPTGFLERLDTRRAGALVDAADTPPQLTEIGRYPVLRALARGGMGVVYLARDPRLDRLVALKLLPPSRSRDPAAAERLFAEARAASALDHPNIGTVYEIAEAADGRIFIAMAYYEGETLRERMARGPLPREDAIHFGIQLADGLAAAHAHGIVHRDIKPENLIVTAAGVLKIVDFGVATSGSGGAGGSLGSGAAVGEAPAAAVRLARGTPAYMSPEQARGAAVDHRTDVWSAGMVLHEMLTGRRAPMGGDAPALPADLDDLIRRCLEPDAERRLESAAALAAGLREAGLRGTRARRRTALPLAVGVVAAASVVLALTSRGDSPPQPPDAGDGPAPAIAVLPFEVRGDSGLTIWREGMVDLLSSNIDGVAGLRAIDSRTILVGWRRETGRHGKLSFEQSAELAKRTGASYAVVGTVVSNGGGIRLDARIHSLGSSRSLGSMHVEGPRDSIFSLIDRLSVDLIAAVWQGRARPAADVNLARLTTTSLPALEAYLEGERALRHADLTGAAARYERAVALDSTFAFALYRLGLTRGWIGDDADGFAELANAALEQAMRHAGRLPERERLLLRGALDMHVGQPHDITTTLPLLRTVVQRYPDDPDAWYLLGEIAYHSGAELLLSRDESEAAFEHAVALDSGFSLSWVHLIHNAFEHRPDSARAAELIREYRRAAPSSRIGRNNELAFALAFGDSATRQRALAGITRTSESFTDHATLDHPRFWATAVAAINAGPVTNDVAGLFRAAMAARFTAGLGRVDSATRLLDRPSIRPAIRAAMLYRMRQGGLPAAPALFRQSLAAAFAEENPEDGLYAHLALFYAAASAADEARWNDHAAGVARLRASAARLLAADDSAHARFVAAVADALAGYRVRLEGDTDRGYRLMADAQRRATWQASFTRCLMNETIRWWIADALDEMGRPEAALRYFESLRHDMPATLRRARIYVQLGDSARAAEAYDMVELAWSGADAELRARLDSARNSAPRLLGDSATRRLGD